MPKKWKSVSKTKKGLKSRCGTSLTTGLGLKVVLFPFKKPKKWV